MAGRVTHLSFMDLIDEYIGDCDGESRRQVERGASRWICEHSSPLSSFSPEEITEMAEGQYSDTREWPDVRSIADGIDYLAAEYVCSLFESRLADHIESDMGDFDAVYRRHPYQGLIPVATLDDGDVHVYADGDSYVAIRRVGRWYVDVTSDFEYEIEEHPILALERSAGEERE
jgi:hypothetical protein